MRAVFPQDPLKDESHGAAVMSLAFSGDGNLLASGSGDGTVKPWDVAAGKFKATLLGHTLEVRSVAWSPDSKRLASGSLDGTVKLWDVETGKESSTLKGHENPVRCVARSGDGKLVASGSGEPSRTDGDNSVRLWDPTTGKGRVAYSHDQPVRALAFSGDSKLLVSGDIKGKIVLYDVGAGKDKTLAGGPLNGGPVVLSLAFTPDGKLLASAHGDGKIKLWDVGAGKVKTTLTSRGQEAYSVAFSGDGKLMASGAADGALQLWDVAAVKEVANVKGDGSVIAVAISRDGKLLASGGQEGLTSFPVRLWDIPDAKKPWREPVCGNCNGRPSCRASGESLIDPAAAIAADPDDCIHARSLPPTTAAAGEGRARLSSRRCNREVPVSTAAGRSSVHPAG